MARGSSDLSVIHPGRSGKLEQIGLTELNRLRGAGPAKDLPPRLGQRIRAQEPVIEAMTPLCGLAMVHRTVVRDEVYPGCSRGVPGVQ